MPYPDGNVWDQNLDRTWDQADFTWDSSIRDEDLGGKVTVTLPASGDLGGQVTPTIPPDQILSGSLTNISTLQHLFGKVTIQVIGEEDLGASATVQLPASGDVSGTVNVQIPPDQLLEGSVTNISTLQQLLGQVTVQVIGDDDLGAEVTVMLPASGDISGSLDVDIPPDQILGGQVTVMASGHIDLGAQVSPTIPPDQLLGGSLTNISTLQHLLGRLTVLQFGGVNLDGSVDVEIPADQILDGQLTVIASGEADLGGKLTNISTDQHLGGTVNVGTVVEEDLGATVFIPGESFEDLGGTINIVTYHFKGILAKIRIFTTVDLGATVFVPGYSFLGGLVEIPTTADIGGKVTVTHELGASITNISTLQQLPAQVTVLASGVYDLGGFVAVGQVLIDLPGTLDVDVSAQILGGSTTVIASGFDDSLQGSVDVGSDAQRLGAEATIIASGNYSLSAQLNSISTLQHLGGSVTVQVIGQDDIDASVDVEANVPSLACPTGYVLPSGAPPLSSGWFVQPSGTLAIPPSGAIVIPSGVYQPEDEILFVWGEPDDWGYDASGAGYGVAWNDDPDHIVNDSDQQVNDNYIDKSWFDAGERWFHVAARNTHGHLGPTCSYNVNINQLPNTPLDPLFVEEFPNPSGISNSSRPTVNWGNATDPDQLDTIFYSVEIEPSGFFIDGTPSGVYIDDIAQAPVGDTSSVKVSDRDLPPGYYNWRVRATDTKQFGPWTDWQIMQLVPATSDISAQVTLVKYFLTNLRAKVLVVPHVTFPATVYVIPYSDLGAKVTVTLFSDIGGKVEIPPKADLAAQLNVFLQSSSDLSAKVLPFQAVDLGAKIELLPSDDLLASVDVGITNQILGGSVTVNLPASGNLGATVDVHGDLTGSVVVMQPDASGLLASATVVISASGDLAASLLVVPYEDLGGTVRIPRTEDIGVIVTVEEDTPDDVVVTATIAEGVWQPDDNPIFFWTEPADDFYDIKEYYYAFNQDPDYVVSDSDLRTNSLTADIFIFDAGQYYFHIRAVNTIDNWSVNTTHFSTQYNNPPGAVSEPLTVEGLEGSPTVGSVAPEFEWGSAEDPDQLDVVRYHIQVSTTPNMLTIVSDVDQILVPGVAGRTTYFLEIAQKLPVEGEYFWWVRSTDSREYGPWSAIHAFIVEASTIDIGGSVSIPTYDVSKLKATVFVIGHSELGAKVAVSFDITEDLGAKVNVTYKTDTDLDARVNIFTYTDLGAKLNIVTYVDLPARVTMLNIPGFSDIGGSARVAFKSDIDLDAKLTMVFGGTDDVPASVGIIPRVEFPATLNVYTTERFGHIDEFNEDLGATVNVMRWASSDIRGKFLSIADRPGPVIISSNIEEDVWQENSLPEFEWTQSTPGISPLEGYYTQLDQSPTTQGSDAFQKTFGFFRSFNLELLSGAGIYYFHVAAKNQANKFGPTDHYKIKYNHLVSAPTLPMTVNGLDTKGAFPLLPSTSELNFEWGQSSDQDDLDIITYKLEVATKEDFTPEITGASSIKHTFTDIPTFRHAVNGGVILPGTWYWRVKAFDGNQESQNYGPVGHFLINRPPDTPGSLIVY